MNSILLVKAKYVMTGASLKIKNEMCVLTFKKPFKRLLKYNFTSKSLTST